MQHFIQEAHSAGWRSQQASAARRYVDYCAAAGIRPFPVIAESLGPWLTRQLLSGKKASSAMVDMSAIKAWCKAHSVDFLSTAKDKLVIDALARGAKASELRPTVRPTPTTLVDIARIAAVVDWANHDERQLYLQVLVSHHAMLRAGESCDYRILSKHVEEFADGSFRLAIFKSKTTRLSADAAFAFIIPASVSSSPGNWLLDAAPLLRHYLRRSNVALYDNAPLFAKLDARGVVRVPFQPQSYNAWHRGFTELCRRAGIPRRTPHSLRAGGLTDAIMGGVPRPVAAKLGRWARTASSDVYFRPGRAAAVQLRAALDERLAALPSCPGVGAPVSKGCHSRSVREV